MKISVTCPSCNSQLNAPHNLAGKTVACPKCKTKVHIPDKPSSARADSSPRKPVPAEGPQEDSSSLGELIPLGDDVAQKPISLTKKEMLVGRHEDCDITLPSQSVSGNHCKLILNHNGY